MGKIEAPRHFHQNCPSPLHPTKRSTTPQMSLKHRLSHHNPDVRSLYIKQLHISLPNQRVVCMYVPNRVWGESKFPTLLTQNGPPHSTQDIPYTTGVARQLICPLLVHTKFRASKFSKSHSLSCIMSHHTPGPYRSTVIPFSI